MLDKVNENHKQNVHTVVMAYHKEKTFYDKKTSAQPLKVNKVPLNPLYNKSWRQQFKSFHWKWPYKVMTKVLSNSDYILRQIGTHKFQCVHRIQLQPVVPQDEIEDIQVNQKDL